MSDAVVIVRSRQRLSELVAQHVTRPFSADVLARNPGLVPDYTTWAGVEAVIQALESAGYEWSIHRLHPGQADEYHAELCLGKARSFRYARSAPIALCLASLDSAGGRVRLEL